VIRNVAVPVLDSVAPFELGVLCEVFGLRRESEPLIPAFDFALCTPTPGQVRTSIGFELSVTEGLDRIDQADLVALPAMDPDHAVPEELAERLRAAVARGAYVMSVCSGAFVLGGAGLLDDRDCTTHWAYADELARRHPSARVNPRVLYVEDRRVLTSAGTAAGIDACLYLLRKEFGERAVSRLARRMVVPPHRDGGQAQFIETPVPAFACETLQPVLEQVLETLDRPHTVDTMAELAHMAPRTFARRFRSETGVTPHDWLTGQRMLLARRLLEDSDLGVDAIADRAGFGSAATLRHHFGHRLSTTPQAYRTTFKTRVA
jgi:AraC family transcriptional regulator, transcriptional activator FtrA